MKLSQATKILLDAGIENPRHDARELFIHIGGMGISELISGDPACDKPELYEAIERRKNSMCLQQEVEWSERWNLKMICMDVARG